jgi:hypothetical protein
MENLSDFRGSVKLQVYLHISMINHAADSCTSHSPPQALMQINGHSKPRIKFLSTSKIYTEKHRQK